MALVFIDAEDGGLSIGSTVCFAFPPLCADQAFMPVDPITMPSLIPTCTESPNVTTSGSLATPSQWVILCRLVLVVTLV